MKYQYDISVTGNIHKERPDPNEINSRYLFIPGGIFQKDVDDNTIDYHLSQLGYWINSLNVEEIIYSVGKDDKIIYDYIFTKKWGEFTKSLNKPFTMVDQNRYEEREIGGKIYCITGFSNMYNDPSRGNKKHYTEINDKYDKRIIVISEYPPLFETREKGRNMSNYIKFDTDLPIHRAMRNIGYNMIEKLNFNLFFYGYSVPTGKLEHSIRYNNSIVQSRIPLFSNLSYYAGRCRFKLINSVYTDYNGNHNKDCRIYKMNIR